MLSGIYTKYVNDNLKEVEQLRLRGGMVSQGSDYDFYGVPGYMNDFLGEDVIEEIRTRKEVEDFPILVAADSHPLSKENDDFQVDEAGILSPRSATRWVAGGSLVEPGSLKGGIPIESVVVEDYVSLDDDMGHETAIEAL